MTKLNKQDGVCLAILTAFYLVLVLILTRFTYVYGSTIDWQEQAWAFPEYFRTLFYETGELFPDFALNIGGGQNIYNFSYYGFLSPVTLLSYLFPFVEMADFIVITSILTVLASVVLFYLWLRRNGFRIAVCFFVSFLFLCAGPLIFQSHRQVMFMNYLPFLLLGFMGVDNYFKGKKSWLLILGTFLMIMTSYYFSVGGMAALFVYGIFRQLRVKDTAAKAFFLSLLRLAGLLMIGVLLAAVLLLPTLAALLNGRSAQSGESIGLLSLLLPKALPQNLFYSPYSLGLTSIAAAGLIGGFFSKQRGRIFLSAVLSALVLFPVFLYVLNGTLYLRAKAIIPFLPLFCMVTAHYIEDTFAGRAKGRLPVIAAVLGIAAALSLKWKYTPLFILDCAVTVFAAAVFNKTGKRRFICIPAAVICAAGCLAVNVNDTLFSAEKQKKLASPETQALVQEVLDADKGFYRFSNELYPLENVNKVYSAEYYQTTLYSSVYNKNYNRFYFQVFNNEVNFRNAVITNATKNVLFDILMGNKYVLTDQPPPIGYELVKSGVNASVYKNDSVFPIGYATDRLMSESDFDALGYPYTQEALLKYAVADTQSTASYSTGITPFVPEGAVRYENLKLREESGRYFIEADENARMTVRLKEPLSGEILFLRFHMDKQSKTNDTYIIINHVKNKLTCQNWEYQNENFVFDYALSSNEPIESLDIVFKKGEYEISGMEAYTLDYQSLAPISGTLDGFEINREQTGGNRIAGRIEVKKDGYFVLNVPYDNGFTVLMDGKEIAYEKVNKAFIGFPVTRGVKKIEITYRAPLKTAGVVLSLAGLLLAGAAGFAERRKKPAAGFSIQIP